MIQKKDVKSALTYIIYCRQKYAQGKIDLNQYGLCLRDIAPFTSYRHLIDLEEGNYK